MEVLVLDSSALGRAVERGAEAAGLRSLIEAGATSVCLLALVEARSIVNTKLRRGAPKVEVDRTWAELRRMLRLTHLVDIETRDYLRAQDILSQETSLSAGDAIHLAVAVHVAESGVGVTFVTADQRQATVAEKLVDKVRLLA